MFDDIPRYKKKSQARPPKKSKHKHLSEPCIIESPADWWKKEHERSGEIKREFHGYCPICGMIRKIDRAMYYSEEYEMVGSYKSSRRVLNDIGRWTQTVETIVELNGRTFSIVWERGLTERQENEYYNQPVEVNKRTYDKTITVTEWIPAGKTARECVTPEELFERLDDYACPRDFGLETKYSKMCKENWGDSGCQGDCKQCWDSEIMNYEHTKD